MTIDYDNAGNTTSANSRLYYYSDNWQVLEEYDTASTPAFKLRYVYGNYIDEALVMSDGTDDYHYLHDHLYSPVALIGTQGVINERYEYNAHGKATVYTNMSDWDTATPTTQDYSAYNNPYLFTGRRQDTLNAGTYNTYYYRNRYYNADTGRFLQKDPLSYVDSMNLYEYVASCPVVNIDPLGMMLTTILPMPPSQIPPTTPLPYPIPLPTPKPRPVPIPTPPPGPTPPAGKCQFREYRNSVLIGGNIPHAGILIGLSIDIDYGPAVKSPVMYGQCPYSGGGPIWGETITHDLAIKKTGKLKNGKSKGKKCKCATCSDVQDCLNALCRRWNGTTYVMVGHNCQTFVRKAKNACCLKRK